MEKNLFIKKSSDPVKTIEFIYLENSITTYTAYKQILKPYLTEKFEFTLELPSGGLFYGSQMLQTVNFLLLR